MTTISASSSTSYSSPQANGESVKTLYDLKHHPRRQEVLEEVCQRLHPGEVNTEDLRLCPNRPPEKIARWSVKFFKSLDKAHDDALKPIKVREWYDSIQVEALFKSGYMQFSNEQFLNINYAVTLHLHFMILPFARRLEYIRKHCSELMTKDPKNFSLHTRMLQGHLPIGELHLIQNENDLYEFAETFTVEDPETEFPEMHIEFRLLTLQQKKVLLRNPKMLKQLLVDDTKKNLRKYLPQMGPAFLNEHLPPLGQDPLFNAPADILSVMDMSLLSEEQLNALLHDELERLDKIQLTEDKLQKVLEVIIKSATQSHGKSMELISPNDLEKIPDSVFQKIDFKSLTEEQLFALFYPFTPEAHEKHGYAVNKGNDGFSSTVIDGFASTTLNFFGEKSTRRQANKAQYNEGRLSLLTTDQYREIRDKLCPEVMKIGDNIHCVH